MYCMKENKRKKSGISPPKKYIKKKSMATGSWRGTNATLLGVF
jgi:hypothetical protein